jgi:anti-sigma factor RsiW
VSGHGSCGEVRQALAVYVLGAIEPADRDVVEDHLAGCTACRDQLAGLAGLPALLHRVAPQEAAAILADDTSSSHLDNLPSGPALRHQLAQAERPRPPPGCWPAGARSPAGTRRIHRRNGHPPPRRHGGR